MGINDIKKVFGTDIKGKLKDSEEVGIFAEVDIARAAAESPAGAAKESCNRPALLV